MAKYEARTKETDVRVDDFIDTLPDERRRTEARSVRDLMERLSGEPARMWGPSIIGFGRYHYRYASGHEGDAARIGFSPRKRELVLYMMGDDPERRELLDRLGPHREGVCCVYLKRLSDADPQVLEQLVSGTLDYMRRTWPD